MSVHRLATPDSQLIVALQKSLEIAKQQKGQMRVLESHKCVEKRLDKWGVHRYQQDADAKEELLYALLEFHETVVDVLKLDEEAH